MDSAPVASARVGGSAAAARLLSMAASASARRSSRKSATWSLAAYPAAWRGFAMLASKNITAFIKLSMEGSDIYVGEHGA